MVDTIYEYACKICKQTYTRREDAEKCEENGLRNLPRECKRGEIFYATLHAPPLKHEIVVVTDPFSLGIKPKSHTRIVKVLRILAETSGRSAFFPLGSMEAEIERSGIDILSIYCCFRYLNLGIAYSLSGVNCSPDELCEILKDKEEASFDKRNFDRFIEWLNCWKTKK
ncbi:hypothetical protein FJZ19_00165 [Candidatus Pacearchaeota archaeon]|nr:hypothetical protein [Candidatus Pacearchaeota archaeon]